MNNLPTRPKIKDNWYVIPTDNYILFRGNGVFKVEGKNFKEFLEVMLPLLKGDRTLEEILNTLSEYDEEDIITALTTLNNEGILEDTSVKIPRNLPQNEIRHHQTNLEYFSRFSHNKYECQGNLKRARVVILGGGVLGSSIASSLSASGVGRVLLIDREKAKTNGFGRKLDSINNHVRIRTLRKELDYRDISGLSGRYDLLVCAPDTYNPSLFNLVNEACLENGIPWIPVYLLEEEGFVGPFTVSKESSCYNCSQVRLLSNSEHFEEDKVFNDYLIGNGEGIKFSIPEFYAEVVSKLGVIEVIDFLSGARVPRTVGNVYIQDFKILSGGLHRVIMVPQCSVCNGSRRRVGVRGLIEKERSRWDGLFNEKMANGDISSLIRRLEKLIDEKTGIIKRSLQSSSSGYLNLFGTYGWLAIGGSPYRVPKSHHFIFSGGTGETCEDAKCSALVEAVERYCCERRDENIIRATHKEVRKYAVNPRDIVLFSENQYSEGNFPWKRFREDSPISWTPGFNLITKEPVLVPADFVYTGASQDRLCTETSNGAAAHSSRVEAIQGGIFEIIERDGLMIMWFNRLPMPKVTIESLPLDALRIVRKVNDFGFDVIIQNITTDIGVPAFCVFIVNRQNKKPALFSGAGCHLNPRIALMKGLREGLRFLTYHLADPKKIEEVKILSYDKLRTPEDHGNLYYDPEMLRYLDFIIESERYQNLDEIKDLWTKDPVSDLGCCLDIFRKKDMDVIAMDCTSSDVADTGLYVIKVIISGMQPIGFGMNNQRLGGRRLYRIPMEMGYTDEERKEEELNMIPHFFA